MNFQSDLLNFRMINRFICFSIDMPEIKPMVVSIWFGRGKPILNEFFLPFVTELNEILDVGIKINGYELKVSIFFIGCDSPARSFVKGIDYQC